MSLTPGYIHQGNTVRANLFLNLALLIILFCNTTKKKEFNSLSFSLEFLGFGRAQNQAHLHHKNNKKKFSYYLGQKFK